jgi:GMP synthase (glutamine-hydrolysing)
VATRLAILKAGSTLPALAGRRGDFDAWIRTGLGLAAEQVLVVDLPRGGALPDYGGLAGVVITGSHAMVTDHPDWSERAADWLPGLVVRRIPLLGICYGHQLLAYAMGGEVGANPRGREFGLVELALLPPARHDPLLCVLAPPARLYASHTQAVLSLPPNAMLLASSPRDAHQAFVLGACAWGVQFHPEFDGDIAAAYIQAEEQTLRAEGQTPEALLQACDDTLDGTRVLRRFTHLVKMRGWG